MFLSRAVINLLMWISVFFLLIFWSTSVPDAGAVRATVDSSADPRIIAFQIVSFLALFGLAMLIQGFGSLKDFLHVLYLLREEASSVAMNIGSILLSHTIWSVVFLDMKSRTAFLALVMSVVSYGAAYALSLQSRKDERNQSDTQKTPYDGEQQKNRPDD